MPIPCLLYFSFYFAWGQAIVQAWGSLISKNHALVFLIILGLKVEIDLHLFACYPQILRLRSVLALLSFLADLRVSGQVL